VAKEYIEDLNIGLLAEEPKEAVKEFYDEFENLFEISIPALTVDETLSWMLTSLKKHTYLSASNVNPAVKNISTFIGREIEYKDINVEVEEKYYNFLNNFFASGDGICSKICGFLCRQCKMIAGIIIAIITARVAFPVDSS
jgi:hypothetical protein